MRCTFCISRKDKIRYKQIFDTIDTDHNGYIDLCDFCRALSTIYEENTGERLHVEDLYKKANKAPDSKMTFREFVFLMSDIERDLKIIFIDLDTSSEGGEIDVYEIKKFFDKHGVLLTDKQAKSIISEISKSGKYSISWEEWRTFNQYNFFNDAKTIVKYMRDYSKMDPEEKLDGWKLLLSGALAGVVSKTVTAPLERLKICYQIQERHMGQTSLFTAVNDMIKKEGFLSLWRSNGVSLLKMVPDNGLKFYSFETIMHELKLRQGENSITVPEKFLAGSMSGLLAQSTVYPLDVIKVRMAIAKMDDYHGIFDCTRQLFKSGGVKSFYRGFVVSSFGMLPYAGIELCVYETLKHTYKLRYPEVNHPGTFIILSSGVISSLCSQAAVYPLSLLRTELQAGLTPLSKRGFFSLAKEIFVTEGLRGFYKGLIPCLTKVIPGVGLSYVVYEETKFALSVV